MKQTLFIIIVLIFQLHILSAEDRMIIICEDVSIEVPIGWQAQYTKSPQIFFLYSPLESNDTFRENCNLSVENLPREYSVSEYKKSSIDMLQQFYSEFQLIESSENYHILKGYIGNNYVQQLQYIYIRDMKAYVLTFTAEPNSFNRYLDIFRKIGSSFTILDNANRS